MPGKLKALNVARIKQPGLYGDGRGLYLQVTSEAARSWLYRYWVAKRDPATGELLRDPETGKVRGQTRDLGLGSLNVVTLAEARQLADKARWERQQGNDPIDARRERKRATAIEQAKALTFADAARQYIAAHRIGWRSQKHAAQWPSTLEAYAYPIIGALPVGVIDTALVMKVLEPLWHTKTVTADRVRGRIEIVLDWATVSGFRTGDNPARWRGHLEHLLPAPRKVAPVKHHPALPYTEIGAFMAELRKQESITARALEFCVLAAGERTSEVIGATWDEIDLAEKVWTVPGARMKSGRDHRVPLSTRALDIVKRIPRSVYVFQGKTGRPIAKNSFHMLLRRMNRSEFTTHGFRSTFKDWARDRTRFENFVSEAALAHVSGDSVERAYARSDVIEKRRRLMQQWADFCGKVAVLPAPASDDVVVPMRKPSTN